MMRSLNGALDRLKNQPALLSFVFSSGLILALCLLFPPYWEANDDLCMSMTAHGYGFVAQGSPNLIYSNVLWGHFVRSLPALGGVLGYSLATMAVVFAVGWAVLYFLLRLGTGLLPGFLAVFLVIEKAALFPQFTINAGLLTVAAVAGWRVHARCGGLGSLWTACLLAFLGYLIRSQEFFLVLGVALPLLPWRALKCQRSTRIAFGVLALALLAAFAFDRAAYSGREWQDFKALDRPLLAITDFSAGERLMQRPDILARHGYSVNDMALIANKFLLDPHLADPKALNAMLDELGPRFLLKGSFKEGMTAVTALISKLVLPLFLSGILLGALLPNRRVALAWAFCLSAFFILGMMGRPGILRVYFPPLSLLLLAPLMFVRAGIKVRWGIVAVVLFAACVWKVSLPLHQRPFKQWVTHQVKQDASGFPSAPFYNWGAFFPLESLCPVLSADPRPRSIKMYLMTLLSLTPYSLLATEEKKSGRGMVERLRSESGIPLVTSGERLKLLEVYCREKWNGKLEMAPFYKTLTINGQRVRCRTQE